MSRLDLRIIHDLVADSPYSRERLNLAWDGLTEDLQMQVLLALRGQQLPVKEILLKALKSKQPYIRYLAAYLVDPEPFVDDELGLKLVELVKNDEEPIVVSALHLNYKLPDKSLKAQQPSAIGQQYIHENYLGEGAQKRQLLDLDLKTHEDLLARITMRPDISPYAFALHLEFYVNVIREKVQSGHYQDDEIIDLLNQLIYSLKQTNIVKYDEAVYEGHDAELNPVWRLCTVLPEKLTYPILSRMPTAIGGKNRIEKNVLLHLSAKQLCVLLSRNDFVYPEMRKEIFFSDLAKRHPEIRYLAAQYYMPLTYEELDFIFEDPGKDIQKVRALAEAGHFELCMIEAINDFIIHYEDQQPIDDKRFNFELRNPELAFNVSTPVEAFEKRMSQLTSLDAQKDEAIKLSLYRIAKAQSDDIQTGLSDDLQFLKELVIPNKPWKTFIRFYNALFGREVLPDSEQYDEMMKLQQDKMHRLQHQLKQLTLRVEGQTHQALADAILKQAEMLQLLYERQHAFEELTSRQKNILAFSKKVKYASIVGIVILSTTFLVHYFWF